MITFLKSMGLLHPCACWRGPWPVSWEVAPIAPRSPPVMPLTLLSINFGKPLKCKVYMTVADKC